MSADSDGSNAFSLRFDQLIGRSITIGVGKHTDADGSADQFKAAIEGSASPSSSLSLFNGIVTSFAVKTAWTPVGEKEKGVTVPASAAVISNGKFYCYVEEKEGTFVRTEFDPGRPTADGYFVKEGIEPGAKIVTRAAGQLLARETNPSKEPE